jgi:uncharacterized surface protein with fasciclin (FAS1) repeats
MLRAITILSLLAAVASAFHTPSFSPRLTNTVLREQKKVIEEDDWDDLDVVVNTEKFLKLKYPDFYDLMCKNQNIWRTLKESNDSGYTLFVPNAKAFEDLGDKKRGQLEDVRNLETAQKVGAYHVVPTEKLTATQLFTEDWTGPRPAEGKPRPLSYGGLVTLGGELPVTRSKSGGFLGFGATEDGDAVVGPDAKIIQSFDVGKSCVVHEMDALVSPVLLWRYCDQLRIPGF